MTKTNRNTFGSLTVLSRKGRKAICRCVCGKEKEFWFANITSGKSTSCGCQRGSKIGDKLRKHGDTRTNLYRRWCDIKTRTTNPNYKSYQNYGGRGIKMFNEWEKSYIAFREWALNNGYKKNLTIERINNNKGYTPENCRWVQKRDQARNKRNNLKWKGETATEASIRLGGAISLVSHRVTLLNWDIEKAFTTPVKK